MNVGSDPKPITPQHLTEDTKNKLAHKVQKLCEPKSSGYAMLSDSGSFSNLIEQQVGSQFLRSSQLCYTNNFPGSANAVHLGVITLGTHL